MNEELIKAAIGSGKSALGRFVRLWLLGLVLSSGGIAALAAHMNPDNPGVAVPCFIVGMGVMALPVAVAVAIVVIAVSF